ncbi:hypothetical protein [Demequina sp. NBRC 110053]|uniref:hypothetical protein n=1 Tax=Demequina sp. NBRC 110053 TaxID=1570342 RepID=UPI000A06C39D|nr:hypothetical protein [Demequina sp. NBRC 110053]
MTDVLADAESATVTQGSRVIFTSNVPLTAVEPSQVTIEPTTAFTVDTAGRTVGVRLVEALAHDTEYTITVDRVVAVGGGPPATFSTSLRTPPGELLILQREPEGPDRIERLTMDGESLGTIFEHDRIEDFRATQHGALVAVSADSGAATLMLVSDEGTQEVTVPGHGLLSRLQVSEADDRFGYLWTALPSALPEDQQSGLFIGDLENPGAEPTLVEIGDGAPLLTDFRLIPRSTSVLALDTSQQLLLADQTSATDPTVLGGARWIDDLARFELTALIRTQTGPQRIDLTTGSLSAVEVHDELGTPYAAEDLGDQGVLRSYLRFAENGPLESQSVVLDGPDGESVVVAEVDSDDALVQVCAAPTGARVAVAVAPQIVSNPLDDHLMAVPERVETRVVEVESGEVLFTVPGFAASWCRVPAI